MLKAVIVDNEKLVLDLLKMQLEETNKIEVIGEFTKPSIALKEIPALQADVVFLDIEMPGMNGIELGTRLLEMDNKLDIVFVTAYGQYAIEAFKLNAIHYILKPADQGSINETIQRLLDSRRLSQLKVISKQNRIELFGGIKIFFNGKEARVKWTTVKVEELFAILIINRMNGIEKEQIIDALWPQTEWKKAEQNLYSSIYRLKKSLCEAGMNASIVNSKGKYFLEIDSLTTDVDEFDTLSEAEYERAISLYKGELFGERYYPWAEDVRNKYRNHGDRLRGSEQQV